MVSHCRQRIQTKYDKLKVDILRGLLALRDLPTTGKKAELAMRLFEDDTTNESLAALKAIQQSPTLANPSPNPDPEQNTDLCYPRQNHTSYYESLDTAQLVYHLHERDLSVHGNQEELVERLREHDWNGSESEYSESDDEEERDRTASFYHPTVAHQYRYYDGKGLHPSILIGLRIQGFSYDPKKGLRLHCDRGCFNVTFCGWPWPTSVGLPAGGNVYSGRIRLDQILQNGLRSVEQLNEQGGIEATSSVSGEKPGNLLIVRAVVAEREEIRRRYRVLGLQCEGMSMIGYVYADDKDSVRVKRYGRRVNYWDVALGGENGQ